MLLVIGIIPILLFITLQQFIRNKAIAILIAISSILIIGPLFGIWSGYEAERDLLRNGIKTKGIVVEKWWSNPKNKTGEWLLKCQFNVASNSFRTFSKKDKNNLYILGDTLTILYSSKDPENNTIIELK